MPLTKPIDIKRALLTEEQLASLCEVTVKTIHQWARDGKIPGAKKVGRRWRFNPEKVERWLGMTPSTIQA